MSSPLPEPGILSPTLVRGWQADQASDLDIQRAYVRFLGRGRAKRRSPALVAAGWVLAGMLLGMGSLYAATVAVPLLFQPAPSASESLAGAASPKVEPGPAESPQNTPSAPVVAPAEPAASSTPRRASSEPIPAPSAPEEWQRVSRAMRDHDYARAEAALDQLEPGASGNEREAAQLVRAQLLLKQGRVREATVLLQALQASARSPSVRQKAAELLAVPKNSVPSQRSFELPEGPK